MTSETGFWGPDAQAPVQQTSEAPTERRWGGISVALAVLFGLILNVGLAAVVIVKAFNQTPLDSADPEAVQKVMDDATRMLTSSGGILAALILQWVWFLGGPWLISHLRGLKSLKRDFGLTFKKVDLLYGLLLGLILQGMATGLTSLVDLGGSDNTNMVTDHHGIWLVLIAVGACTITPLSEELFFRGLLLRAIMRTKPGGWFPVDENGVPARTGTATAVVAVAVTSLIFGSLHMTTDGSLANSLPLMAITGSVGAVFAVVAIKTKRIGITVIGHCVFNTVSIIAVLISTGRLF